MTDKLVPAYPKITVIVPVYNKVKYLFAAAESIMTAARHSGAEVIFVDHGSTDGSREVLATYSDAKIIDHRGGTVGAVRNAGAVHARGQILCFIDSDVVIKPCYFERVCAVLTTSGSGAVGCEVDVPPDAQWLERTWHALNALRSSGYRQYINAANLAVTREAFETIGGFDERLVSAEETDLCRRLVLSGYTIYESQDLSATHLDNPKTLEEFFRKQIWHGLGVPSSDLRLISNKPMTMAAVHMVLVFVAIFVLAFPIERALGVRAIIGISTILAVPSMAYAYRVRQTGRWVNLLPALLLLEVYFLARGIAIAQLIAQRIRNADLSKQRT